MGEESKIGWKISKCPEGHVHILYNSYKGAVRGEMVLDFKQAQELADDLAEVLREAPSGSH